MAPEDLTIEYFERLPNFSEPIVIPRHLNPRPSSCIASPGAEETFQFQASKEAEESLLEQEVVADEGQDKMDMVIPEGLTVARVAELYGPEMPIEVIDVKSQEGDSSKKWTVQKWADYYESEGDRPIRNVISLEVTKTPFGRLIRRPRVVRDLDLQDAVWPESDTSRTPVSFYCLMSVADCYTDFHIDFGGSSVYYHILKGKKVFFFIPPTKQNLKKYEDWCISPAQNETFLPDQTKECYRVDLSAGDTMLIPSGWIHSVWTPENSLVIGGNFLTRLHLNMQIRIMEIEKNTKVPLKYRYPQFQKVQWYTILKYLQLDPLPSSVHEQFVGGKQFSREKPIWTQHDKFGHNSDLGVENYHARYYSKTESEGWPDLVRYIFRTVLIHEDRLEGITQESRKAVMRSIPKGYGEPLDNARKFAMWVAWKRGNEDIPQWAHPDAVLPTKADEKPSKWSSLEVRKVERRVTLPPRTSHRLGPKKVVCEPCREKKIACKHVEPQSPGLSATMVAVVITKQPDGDISAVSTPSSDKRRWGKACNECRKSKVSALIYKCLCEADQCIATMCSR
jgi:F-box/leucine-rich repeat protein 10/11